MRMRALRDVSSVFRATALGIGSLLIALCALLLFQLNAVGRSTDAPFVQISTAAQVLDPYTTVPLSTAELTVAKSHFADSWNIERSPCRALSTIWHCAIKERCSSRFSVSTVLANRIILNEPRQSHLRRRVRTIALACRLERTFEDRELLRVWLSSAYFGGGQTGIEQASTHYFAKPSNKLDVCEAARLDVFLRMPSIRHQTERWNKHLARVLERVDASPADCGLSPQRSKKVTSMRYRAGTHS